MIGSPSASNGLDYYGVSLVDGYNLPASITPSAGFHDAAVKQILTPTALLD